jgi:hypothetical protein
MVFLCRSVYDEYLWINEDGVACILTKLWAGRPGFDSWEGQERDHRVRTVSGAHPTSYPMVLFPWE